MSTETSPRHATHLASSFQTPAPLSSSSSSHPHSYSHSHHDPLSHLHSHSADPSQLTASGSFASSSTLLDNGSGSGSGAGSAHEIKGNEINGVGSGMASGTGSGADASVGFGSIGGTGPSLATPVTASGSVMGDSMVDLDTDMDSKNELSMESNQSLSHSQSLSQSQSLVIQGLPTPSGDSSGDSSGSGSASGPGSATSHTNTSTKKATGSKGKNGATGPADGKTKPHICQICHRGFTTGGHLQRHQRIHTGVKAFKCPFPGCETRTSRQDNLQQQWVSILSSPFNGALRLCSCILEKTNPIATGHTCPQTFGVGQDQGHAQLSTRLWSRLVSNPRQHAHLENQKAQPMELAHHLRQHPLRLVTFLLRMRHPVVLVRQQHMANHSCMTRATMLPTRT